MNDTPSVPLDRPAAAIAGGYLLLATGWVVLTDLAFASMSPGFQPLDPTRLLYAWTLVAVSTLGVYLVAIRYRRRAGAVRSDLAISNQQLQVLSRVFRHNVRNDLNVVRGYTHLIEDRVDDEEVRRHLETIRETTDDVVAISEKLSVVEETSPRTPSGRVDLVNIVDDAVEDFEDEDVDITVIAPSEAWIRADSSVRYPVREVFENAIAHNDKPTCRVDARIDVNGTATYLEVRDNGPGIPENERQVLQAEEETPLSHASSIGLWLVKWMCELHGGTVRFDASDDGTTVRLRFNALADDPIDFAPSAG
ncbi:sensor histidine kinase [Halorubrum vacuolatum]